MVRDTGLFDLMMSAKFISKEIVTALQLSREGFHAVVLVLTTRNRFTKEEEDALSAIQVLFGSAILNYCIVVFTGGDELERNGHTLEDYLQGCPEFLQRILTLCGNRKVLFDNITENEEKKNKQIEELLAHVADIENINKRIPFTSKMHREIQQINQIRWSGEMDAKNLYFADEAKRERVCRNLHNVYETRFSQMQNTVEETLRNAYTAQMALLTPIQNTRSCNIM